jgi:hypothetical protein
MLTKRQNFLETIRGGNPDRYVAQHEAFVGMIGRDPLTSVYPIFCEPGGDYIDAWGVYNRWDLNAPGPFPIHDAEHKVLVDITKWREIVKRPNLDFPESVWQDFVAQTKTVDRNEYLLMLTYLPGVFEELHYLMGMEDTLINFYEEPDEIKAIIDFLVEFELEYLQKVFSRVEFDAFFQDDDWGSANSTFLSPAMFKEFLLPAYKKIYGFVKQSGVEVVIHHSDSYAATLVPYMIEMGVDVWQGAMWSNNIPELLSKHNGKITFMGGIDNAVVDVANWTPDLIRNEVERVCRACGTSHFIPSTLSAGPMTTYPEVFDAVTEEIRRVSKAFFTAS